MVPSADEILDRLAEAGGRRTAARRAIVEAVLRCGSHVTAEDVAAKAGTVDLSTVYRTLDAMERAGIIDHVHLGHGRAIYHFSEDDHQHLVCERCERVVELPAADLREFLNAVEQDYGFSVNRRHFALVGLCADCRNK